MRIIKKYWVYICSFLAIGIFGYLVCTSAHQLAPTARQLGHATGRATFFALIAFFAAYFFRKRLGLKRSELWISCFAISFSLCSILVIKSNKEKNQLINVIREFKQITQDPDYTSFAKEYSKEEYGSFSTIFPLIRNSNDSYAKMFAEINEITENLQNILNIEYLSNLQKIDEGKQIIATLMNKLDFFEKSHIAFNNAVISEVSKAFSKNEFKKEFLLGFEKGQKDSNTLINEYFSLEKESAQTIDNLLDFFSIKSGNFWVSDGTLYFENDEDLDRLNQLAQKLNVLGEQEIELNKKFESLSQSTFNEMQALIKLI